MRFRSKQRWINAIALCLISFLAVMYPMVIEPSWLAMTQLNVTLPHLDPAFENYKIVHFTDIHADDWMIQSRLQKLVTQVNRYHPNLIALTGDFVTTHPEKHGPTLLALKNLQATDGVYAVLGNHDHWSNPQSVRQWLKQAGVTELPNEVHRITREGQVLAIAGVDDIWVKQDNLDRVLGQLPSKGAHILLAHEPDFADTSAATHAFDLELSGHAHGGQVKLPLLGAPQLPPYGRKYPFGLYEVDGMLQYTGRGVGMVRPRVRFNARPEITVITLHAPKNSSIPNARDSRMLPLKCYRLPGATPLLTNWTDHLS